MIRDVQVGKNFSFSRSISDGDIQRFAEITGDFNPLHLNLEYSRKTRFKERIAHGFLTASLISAAISKEFPGAIYLSQSLKFIKAVKIGDKVTALIKILSKDEKHNILKLSTICFNQHNEEVIQGDAVIMIWQFYYSALDLEGEN